MTDAHNIVSDRNEMLAGMQPVLQTGTFHYCYTNDSAKVAALVEHSFAVIREAEGMTLILPAELAALHGFDDALPMAHIVLQVYSALEGVGLTAGVASALADAGLSCNIVAAYHHDHVFVPRDQADRAVQVLSALQNEAAFAIKDKLKS